MSTPSPLAPSGTGLAGLIDLLSDAGAEPPADLPDALAPWVGRRCLDDLDVPSAGGDHPLLVTVTGGAGQVAGAARAAAARDALLVVPLRDLDDLGANARRVCAAVAGEVEEQRVLLGMPADQPLGGWLAAADEAAACGLGLALHSGRGGRALPAETVVAALEAALDRECTMRWLGAHPLLPRTGAGPDAGNHAALALLLATRAAWDGEPAADVLFLDAPALLDAVRTLLEAEPDALARARRWCGGVGADAAALARELDADGGLLP